MTQPDDDARQFQRRSSAVKEAWAQTNEEMESIADYRRDEGWDVTSMPAVHTSPVGREQGDDDDFGLAYVIPDNHADAFTDAFERGSFPRYEVYRNEIDGYVYLVTEFLDPESDTCILIAAQYDLQLAEGMVRSALDEGAIYSIAKTIDGTELGSVRHDEVEPFVPYLDRFQE